MQKILLILIIVITLSTISFCYYTNDVLTVVISSVDVPGICLNNYFFHLDRSGNLYTEQVDKNVEVNVNDKKWIKQHSRKIKLSKEYTKKIINKTEEIYDLYYKYQPDIQFTGQSTINILYKNKYLKRYVVPYYPEPYAQMTDPQIDELIKLLVDVAPFYVNETLTMGME